MSVTLLQRLVAHLQDGSLLDGYAVRYLRWSDVDLNGNTNTVMFKMAGTEGPTDSAAQTPHVSMTMLCNPDDAVAGSNDMLAILRYIRANYSTTGIANIFPVGPVLGPSRLQNNRVRYELTVSCLVEDY